MLPAIPFSVGIIGGIAITSASARCTAHKNSIELHSEPRKVIMNEETKKTKIENSFKFTQKGLERRKYHGENNQPNKLYDTHT